MIRVTRSTSPTAFTDARARAVAIASLVSVLALALAPTTAHAQSAETRACIDAATNGQRLRDAGKLRAARDAFLACAAAGCPSMVREDCSTWLAQVSAETPSVVLGARDARGRDLTGVRVFANDALLARALDGRAYPLDPGPYRFRFERDDGAPVLVDVVLRAHEIARQVVASFPATDADAAIAPPPSGASGRTIAMGVLGGAAIVGAGGVLFFGLRARGDVNDLRGTCASACDDNQERGLHTDLFLANLSLGVGIASLGALVAVALWPRAQTPTAARSPARLTIAPAIAGTGASLRLSF